MKTQENKQENRPWVLYLVVAAAAVLLLLIGSAMVYQQRKERDITILRFGMFAGSYWDVPTGNCYQVIDDAIGRFEQSHPGVQVEYVSGILKDDYPEWLAEQVLLGQEPDVFIIPAGEFDMLTSLGVLKNLDLLMEADDSFHKEDYYEAACEYGSIGQKQYALPFESVPTLMFVNKSLLEKEGIRMPDNNWTWEEFLAICQQVTRDTDGDGVIDQFGCYDYGWQDAVCANGADLFDENGTVSYFGDGKVEAAVRFVRELNTVNQGYAVTSKEFDKGKVAFRPLAFSEYRTYKPYPWRIKKYSDFEWDCVKMPAGPEGGSRSEVDTLLMGLGSRTAQEQLAWEFIKALCYEVETQEQLLKDSQGVSVLRHVTGSPAAQAVLGSDTPGIGDMDMEIISQVMEDAAAAPNFRMYPNAMMTADTEIGRLLSGEVSMDSGLLKLQREVNGLLK